MSFELDGVADGGECDFVVEDRGLETANDCWDTAMDYRRPLRLRAIEFAFPV